MIISLLALSVNLVFSKDSSYGNNLGVNNPPVNKMVLFFPFEGNSNDQSGNYNTGTVYGANLTDGKLGQAYDFDGINDYIEIRDSETISLKNAITISAWIKDSGIIGPEVIIAKDNEYMMRINQDSEGNTASCFVYLNNNWEPRVVGARIPNNIWTHVTCSFDNSTGNLKIYINGRLNATKTGRTGSIIDTTNPLNIGKRGAYFKGVIDEVKIWNYALSDYDILTEYYRARGCTPNCTGRQCGTDSCEGICGTCASNQTCNSSGQCVKERISAYLPFNGNSNDISGNNNHGICLNNNIFPLYRLYKNPERTRLYTISEEEKNNAINNYGYVFEGPAGFIYGWSYHPSGTVPLYRLRSSSLQFLYTIDEKEKNDAIANYNYIYDGISGYVYPLNNPPSGTLPLYRLHSSITNQFLYTLSEEEKNNVIANYNFVYDGITCYIYYDYICPVSVPGRFKEAYKFDGINDYLEINNSDDFNFNSFTISVWINTSNAGDGRRRIISQQLGDDYWILALNNNTLEFGSSKDKILSAKGRLLNDSKWHYLTVVRYSKNKAYWYVDGNRIWDQDINNPELYNISANIQIGRTLYYGRDLEYFNGMVDELRVRNYALSSGEVKREFDLYLTGGDDDEYEPEYEDKATIKYSPKIATDSNGDFVLTWNDRNHVYLEKYNSDMKIINKKILVDENITTKALSRPEVGSHDVSMSSSGKYVVAWESNDQIKEVHFKLFDNNGKIIKDFALGNNFWAPDVTMDSKGNFVLVYENMLNSDIIAQEFDYKGNPITDPFKVNSEKKSLYSRIVKVLNPKDSKNSKISSKKNVNVALNKERIVFVWKDNEKINGVLMNINDNSINQSSFSRFKIDIEEEINKPVVAIDSFGNFIVTWASDTNKSESVYIATFNKKGKKIMGPTKINKQYKSINPNPDIALYRNKDFFVVYEGIIDNEKHMLMQKVELKKELVLEPFVISGTSNLNSNPSIAASNNGLAVVYEFIDNNKNNPNHKNQIKIFDNVKDLDLDNIQNNIDNCPNNYNPMQIDKDYNEIGDACENNFSETEKKPVELVNKTMEKTVDNIPDKPEEATNKPIELTKKIIDLTKKPIRLINETIENITDKPVRIN